MSETDPKEVLRQARQLVKSEQYAEALEKYIWFHHHALEADRALAGVRLSYAIFEWVDLGGLYPPAQRALESVRDAKTESLIQGTYDPSLFHDVASISLRIFGEFSLGGPRLDKMPTDGCCSDQDHANKEYCNAP